MISVQNFEDNTTVLCTHSVGRDVFLSTQEMAAILFKMAAIFS